MFTCSLCHVRGHKNTQHDFPIKATNADPDYIINEVDNANLKEGLLPCQHFQIDSELGRARQKVLNYATTNLNAKFLDKKFDQFFNDLKYAAKVNLAFEFMSKT